MIYFIQASSGPVKIGFTKDENTLQVRLRTLQVANADLLVVIRTTEGNAVDDEPWMHAQFERIRGEWFRFDPLMLTIETPLSHLWGVLRDFGYQECENIFREKTAQQRVVARRAQRKYRRKTRQMRRKVA